MSGHSKWSTIKHKKAAADAKRGKVFTRVIKEITVAARMGGGGDPDSNPRLRKAISSAKVQNVPQDTVERAIKRGTGELEGVTYEEILYEGYGPGGVAILVETMTDNRNRTVSEIRHLFAKYNGNMGETGSVSWMFTRTGLVIVEKANADEEKVMEVALEAGATDVQEEDDTFEIQCGPLELDEVVEVLKKAGLKVKSSETAMIPKNTVTLDGRNAEVMLRLMNAFEEHDDVQNVWANFDIDDKLIETLAV